MEPRVITTKEDHAQALAELDRLMALSPRKGTPEGDRLELFAFLIEKFEQEAFPIENPTPLQAIKFRMEEQSLTARDLKPFIGSRSKVSEVLSAKIGLSLRMIRELSRGLGIPLDVLMQGGFGETSEQVDWTKVPVSEIVKLGWMDTEGKSLRRDRIQLAQTFFKRVETSPASALFRRTARTRTTARVDREVLATWLIEASQRSEAHTPTRRFRREALDSEFLRTVVQTSAQSDGPLKIRSLLLDVGVILVVVPHLARTRLDGAAFVRGDGYAVVALTLRHDRIDSFWFTLLHELVHLALHSQDVAAFFDDLDAISGTDPLEEEADRIARNVAIPNQIWIRSAANRKRTAAAVVELAAQQGIHPALAAGRLRFETRNYHLLNNLVGHDQIRHLFRAELGKRG